jgi:hypothetical protein
MWKINTEGGTNSEVSEKLPSNRSFDTPYNDVKINNEEIQGKDDTKYLSTVGGQGLCNLFVNKER